MATDRVVALQERFRPVLSKWAGLALALWGEPGIGKSHLSRALLRELPCRSLSLSALAPLSAWLELPQAALPLWAERTLSRLAAGERLEPSGTVAALGALWAAAAPAVLHLDDLHEASGERLALLSRLAQAARSVRGAGLLVTSRVRPAAPFVALRLEPLPREAAGRLLAGELGAALPAEAAAWIYARAAGNPLFTLEFCRYLARQGYLWNDGKRWHWRPPPEDFLPTTVEALVEQLVAAARASPLEGYALEARALLDEAASTAAWAHTARLSPAALRSAVRALEQRGLLARGAFAHPLFKEVTLKTLAPGRRRDLARRALNAHRDEPERAAHFVEPAALEPEEASRLLRAAAARSTGARAARFLAQAARYAEGEARAELALEAATALAEHDRAEAAGLWRLVLEVWPQHPEAVYALAARCAEEGRSAEVEALLARLPPSERARRGWTRRLIGLRFSLGDHPAVLALWEEAQGALEPDADLAYQVGFSRVLTGDYIGAAALAEAALARPGLGSLERAKLLSVAGLARFYRGEEAEALFDAAVAAARASGKLEQLAAALHNRSMFYEETSREAEMLADTEEALRLYAEAGSSRHYASTLTKRARILHQMGEYERAEEAFLESREILSRGDHATFLVTCEASLSALYLDWRPSYGAVLAHKHAQEALRLARPLGERKLVLALGALALAESAQGRHAEALALAEACAEAALKLQPEPAYQALHARGKALEGLGERAAALSAYAEAERLARNADWRVHAEKIGLERDRLQGDLASARRRLAWFEAHGLINGANLARRHFPALDAAPAPPEASASGPRLEVLGPMRLGGPAPEPLRGLKRQQLLLLLLEARVAGRGEVSQLELLDALYPGDNEAAASVALKQLVFQLRKSLGAAAILRTAGGYALGNVTSDAEAFLASGNTQLWRGPYCQNAIAGDETVASALYHALQLRAAALLEDDPQEAGRLGRLLLAADPYDAQSLRLSLQALQASGDQRGLERLYRQSCANFAEVGETLPERWADFLRLPA